MSATDNRIVKMVFEYAQFKRGAMETKQALTDVDRAIATTGKGKGLLDLQGGMQKVGLSASKMAIVTTTALATITNKVVNAGINMAKSLTFDPIKAGFSEYESLLTKQNVIMNATGKSAGSVKKVLNDLNKYSDKTIFSFGDMTEALTSFVNAGVPLEKASMAMKGIANASALAGASTQESQSSFRAFSQALGQGFLGLQDFRQAAVTGKIGTVQFKQTLIDAAVAAGTLTKKGDEYITKSGKALTATKNFDLSLQEQWANTQVLNSALGTYGDIQTKTGKKAFKAAQDVRTFSAFVDTLKESLGSGWAQVFGQLSGGLEESTKRWTGLSNTVSESVGKFFDWASATAVTFKAMGGITKVVEGFKNIISPAVALFTVLGDAWRTVFPSKGPGSGDMLYKVASAFEAITSPLQYLATGISKLTPFFVVFFESIRSGSGLLGKLGGALSGLGKALLSLDFSAAGDFVGKIFSSIKDKLGGAAAAGKGVAEAILSALGNAFGSVDYGTVTGIIGTGLLAAVVLMIKNFTAGGLNVNVAEGLFGSLKEGIGAVKESFGAVTDTMSAMQTQLKSKTLMQIAIAIGLITLSVVALSAIDAGNLQKAMAALAVGFAQLMIAMAILTKIAGTAGFIKVPVIAASMILLAGALFILVAAIALMSLLSWDQIGRGLAGVGGALVVISAGMKLMPKSLPLTAAGLVLVAFALNGIATAMMLMATMSWEEIGKGLTGVAGALVVIALAMQLMPLSLPITAAGLVMVGIALNGVATALLIMGGMSWDEIGRGLATLGGAMAILALGLNGMSGTLFGSAALLVAAAALAILTPSIVIMSKLSWKEIGKGMAALAGGLTILAIAMYAMSGAIVGAVALLIIAPAILALTTALMALSTLSWEELGTALVALAAGLAIIGLAGLLIGPVVPALIGLGIALALMGVGLALAGVGILAFSAGLSILMALGAAAFTFIGDAVMAFIDLLAPLGEGFVDFLVSMAESLAAQAPVIAAAFVVIFMNMLKAAEKLLPKLGDFIIKVLDQMIKVIVKYIPKLAAGAVKLIAGFLDAITRNLGSIITSGTNLIIAWVQGIANAAPKIAVAAADAVIKFINDMAAAIRTKGPELGDAMGNLGTAMVEGLIGGIKAMAGQAVEKIKSLAGDMVKAAKDKLKVFSPSRVFKEIGKFLVMGLTQGIQENAASAITAVASMVSGQIAVASSYVNKFVQRMDQQAIAAAAKARGLAIAADRAEKAASKTKSKADDRAADRLGRKADQAQKVADRKQAKADAAEEAAERAEQFKESSTIDKAKMRSEDAQNALDSAKAAEGRAEADRVAAAALDRQSKQKGLSAKDRKSLQKQADDLRAKARAEAINANKFLERAKKYASDALALQTKDGQEAADAFEDQFELEAKSAADEAAFEKLTDEEKAKKRREDAEALRLKSEKDLADAKKLAFTDLDAANDLAKLALDEAQQAREYLKDAESYSAKGASGVSTGGGVVSLDASEAASIAFNGYSDLYDASTAAAAGAATVEFNQYNSSPEALSPIEIYRNTNKQLTFAIDKLDEAA